MVLPSSDDLRVLLTFIVTVPCSAMRIGYLAEAFEGQRVSHAFSPKRGIVFAQCRGSFRMDAMWAIPIHLQQSTACLAFVTKQVVWSEKTLIVFSVNEKMRDSACLLGMTILGNGRRLFVG